MPSSLTAQSPGFDPRQFIINAFIATLMITNIIRSADAHNSDKLYFYFCAVLAGISASALIYRLIRGRG